MSKLEKIYDRLNSIDTTLAAQHESLKDHIRRTEILEQELKPVKVHVIMVNGALKFVALLGVIAAIVETIYMVVR